MPASGSSSATTASTSLQVLGAVAVVGCVSAYAWFYQSPTSEEEWQEERNRVVRFHLPEASPDESTTTTESTSEDDGEERRLESSTSPNQETAAREADKILHDLFLEATKAADSLPGLNDTEKLLLYSFYQQATVGNNTKSAPSIFQVVERAKHMAWMKASGMTKEQAMIRYMQVVKQVQSNGGGGTVQGLSMNSHTLSREDNASNKKRKNANQTAKQKDEMTLEARLVKSVRAHDWETLQDVLDKGAAVDHVDESGHSALHYCADHGLLEGAEILIGADANVNMTDGEGIGILQAAVIADHPDIALLLLENGADPYHEDMDGDSPLSCAIEDGSDVMNAVFRDTDRPEYLEARLRSAARNKDLPAMEELIGDRVNVDAADPRGQTAMHVCADVGFVEGIQLLLGANATVHATDKDGISTLQTAVISDHPDVAGLLIDNGADPDLRDVDGDTPRSYALEGRSSKQMKQFFRDL